MKPTELRTCRVLAGLSQDELSKQTGIDRTTIIALEQGKRPARPRTLKALARALGVTTRELVERP